MLRPMRVWSRAVIPLLALLLTAGCGQEIAEQLSTSERASAAAAGAGPSCEERALDAPPDSAISWAHYLRWGDRVYTSSASPGTAEPVVPSELLGEVSCKRSNSLTPVAHIIADGEAAYLEAGTPIYAIAGRSADDAVTAIFNGDRLVFTFDKQLTANLVEAQRPAGDVLRVPAGEVSGATICKSEHSVDLPDKQCRELDQSAAGRVAKALDGAVPFGAGTDCLDGDAPVYKITLGSNTKAMTPIVVWTGCGPVSVGDRRYRVHNEIVETVTSEHDAAER